MKKGTGTPKKSTSAHSRPAPSKPAADEIAEDDAQSEAPAPEAVEEVGEAVDLYGEVGAPRCRVPSNVRRMPVKMTCKSPFPCRLVARTRQ